MSPLNMTAIGLVRLYQILTRARPSRCIHEPSCSDYAVLALRRYPLPTALGKAWGRLRDCHPFSGRPYVDLP